MLTYMLSKKTFVFIIIAGRLYLVKVVHFQLAAFLILHPFQNGIKPTATHLIVIETYYRVDIFLQCVPRLVYDRYNRQKM